MLRQDKGADDVALELVVVAYRHGRIRRKLSRFFRRYGWALLTAVPAIGLAFFIANQGP